MKDISYYSALPDGMTEAELYLEFVEVVGCFENSECSGYVFLAALSELSERQWHTYSLLCDKLRGRIEGSLKNLWDGRNLEAAQVIVSVVAYLGLEGLYAFICSQASKSLSDEVSAEVKSAIAEFGSSVGDPFSGMR
ncbi:hypothetical protein EGM97_20365 [Pseudomonas sp. AF32]|uniref:hypothetical protein n=1 Tax=Pseudomonas sp. AF32 TaxID=554390 RepID=UPI001EEE00BE|nr:hypothetical protein [Pseudomonas sp. AF32]MCG6577055.1 hypothetical protein [Pseudomonas sp. AF32]